MQEPAFASGSLVRVRHGADFPAFRGGERGTVESYNEDARNYTVLLGEPPRQVFIGRRHLEFVAAAPPQQEPHEGGPRAGSPPDDRPGPGDACRFCLEAGEEPLLSPCGCRGSARWVHGGCLRRWQRSVVLSAGNRPEDIAAEQRHRRCAACCQEFAAGLEPVPRGEVLGGLAGIAPDDVQPGALLRYAASYPRPRFEPGYECLMHIFEAQKEHFRTSVYLLTRSLPADAEAVAADGGTPIVGVDLARPLDSKWSAPEPLEELSRGAVSDAEVRSWRQAGLIVSVGLGGPVKPKVLGPALLIAESEEGGYSSGEHRALRDRALQLVREGRVDHVELRLFLGHARWSQEQLLGEITRQSWALVPGGASAADLHADTRHLWRQLEDDGRLRWARDNPLAEEYRARTEAD